MDQGKIVKLKELSSKSEHLVSTSVRIPENTHNEIKKFCGDNKGVTQSVVLREAIEIGWRFLSS